MAVRRKKPDRHPTLKEGTTVTVELEDAGCMNLGLFGTSARHHLRHVPRFLVGQQPGDGRQGGLLRLGTPRQDDCDGPSRKAMTRAESQFGLGDTASLGLRRVVRPIQASMNP